MRALVRGLLRQRGYVALALTTLTFAVGANVVVFTVVNAHDAACDRAVARIDRLAYVTALEAEALGDTRLLDRMGLIRKQCAIYRQADAGEDAGVSKIRLAVGRIVLIVYGMNRRLTLELAKRAGGRARRS